MKTGESTPVDTHNRLGPEIWGANTQTGYFWGGQGAMEIALDWGDILSPVLFGGFGFDYATNADGGTPNVLLVWYDNENGVNTQPKSYIAAIQFTGLAGTITPSNRGSFWGWTYRVELFTPILISSADLDADGLGDWGYTYWFDQTLLTPDGTGDPNVAVIGPVMAGDPNFDNAPGIENIFDIYNDPNYIPAPGYVDPNLTHYVGTYWFGGDPYAQFYMELFAASCPNRGDSGKYCEADIDCSFDCMVGLNDLAQLLGNYGCTTGCTVLMGDVDPYDRFFPGDGVIGLGDLAELLGQYGDDCTLP